ncbi:MAG TPA: DUF1203 domain-containing protein [Candidatus Dormibacteraeota bacterium]|nr:DUF1203 domain-containing protein [Candidatus Dormibacteraeota bacterium]
MQSFRINAIPTEIAESVRAAKNGTALGFPIYVDVAADAAPCRHCLRVFKPGSDRRILFTYDRFTGVEKLPQPGPVYIHAEPCQQYPSGAGFPPELRDSPRTLEAYGKGRRLVAQEYGVNDTFEFLIQKLFARPEVDYVHVNSTTAGCFTFRIDRP